MNLSPVHDYYKATEKGEPYSQLEMATYKIMSDGNSTKYQLRWLTGIIFPTKLIINNNNNDLFF
ncbi:MAG: hypothetical protein AB4060_22315 [Crocosphaera sp.]